MRSDPPTVAGPDYDVPMQAPERLYYTGDEAADRLIASDPLALLIGFTLDQQVTVQKAFSGPLELTRRTGQSLDARAIAAMDPAELVGIFSERPALHRFPGAMAGRVQALCSAIATDYDNDPGPRLDRGQGWARSPEAAPRPARNWRDEGPHDQRRAGQAVRPVIAWPGRVAAKPSLPWGDVDSPEALATYQTGKRAHKAELRAAAAAKAG